jgi:hypothetical protein
LLKSSHYKLNIRSSVIGLWERPASRMFLWTNPQEVSKLKTNFLGLVGEVHITWATSLKRVNPCLQLEDTEEFSTFYSIRNQLTSFDSRPYRSYSSLNRGHRSISTFILAVHKVGINSVYSSWKGGIDTPLTDSKTCAKIQLLLYRLLKVWQNHLKTTHQFCAVWGSRFGSGN